MPNDYGSYDPRQQSLNRQRALAQALQQQAFEPIQMPTVPGAAVSPFEGIAKILQAFVAERQNKKLDKQEKALMAQLQDERTGALTGMINGMVPDVTQQAPQQTAPIQGLPLPQAQPGPQEIAAPPVDPRQVAARQQMVSSLAGNMGSFDPTRQQVASQYLGNLQSQGKEERDYQRDIAKMLAGEKFTSGENALSRQATSGENALTREQQLKLANRPQFHTINPGDLGVTFDPSTSGITPLLQNPKEAGRLPVDQQELDDWLKKNPGKGPSDFLVFKAGINKPPPDADASVTLTPEALDVAARRYLQDGTLPPMGMGAKASAARSKILNRAAQVDPNAAIAANKAEYVANQAALTQLQKNSDAIGAFEKTAMKNLDQFISTASKVRDSGSAWINRGLRSVDRNVLSKPDQAAYDAARQVAMTEIARVVSNPNLNGVLSDSARKEMDSVLSGDATLDQTLRVSKILIQDMNNRKQSVSDQLNEVKGRIRNPSGGGGPKIGDTKTFPNGKRGRWDGTGWEAVN